MSKTENFKVEKISLKNYKGISEFDADLNCQSFIITAGNGKGKSSVLAAMEDLFTGENVTAKQIKQGEDKELIEATVISSSGKKFKIKRTVTEKSSRLEITSPDDKNFSAKQPAKFLQELFGDISLNLNSLLQKSVDKQVQDFKKIVNIDTEFVDGKLVEAETERKKTGQAIDLLKGRLPNVTEEMIEQYKEPKDFETVKENYNNFKKAQLAFDNNNKELSNTQSEIESLRGQIEVLEAKIADKITDHKTISDEQVRITAFMKKNEDAIKEFDTISEYERKHTEVNTFLNSKKEIAEYEKTWELWNERVGKARAKKAEIIAAANIPIPGLSFDAENGIMYKDLPLSEWNTAEKIFVEAALKMSRQNINLKVIRIPEASLLDNENIQRLIDLCNQNGYQVAMEMVSRNPDDLKIEYLESHE